MFYLNEYNKAVAYGKTNADISGVEEFLQNLEVEKKSYFENVTKFVSSERKNEMSPL